MDRTDLTRSIGARSFARLLGEWRPPDGKGLAGALADRIRLLVLDGRLPLQIRVPAERELAGALEVSRTTVATAYDTLRAAEVLRSRRGAGSWTQSPSTQPGAAPGGPLFPYGGWANLDLAHASLPAPSEQMRDATAGAIRDLDAHLCTHGYDLIGLPVLRDAIAARYTARGLPTTRDQVLVTAGGQQGISLALLALAGPGDRVLIEHPTYPNALDSIRNRGARPIPVPLSPSGDGSATWDLDLLTAAVRDAAPRLAYVIPDYQNPSGALLSNSDRERLVDLARRTSTPLLVDETLAEVPLEGPPPEPVASFGAPDSALVITIGSASKMFWGGLRIGWIRTSASMVRRLAALRASVDLGSPVLEQLVTARLMTDIDQIVQARRVELSSARDHLRGKLAATFPGWQMSRPTGGLCLWVDLGEPVSSRLTIAARRHDLLLSAGPRFGVDGAFERFLRLPYTLRRDRMDAAVDVLVTAWHELDGIGHVIDPDPMAVA
ncbi:MocR-like transcription factor YczR [Pseudonocardia sp. TRM90224]|uniref:MocR-like transcription factor YczR n=1 Tax=Pseudonocardia sp. TRM90224 TaxID=2812678 RepID=UPI001E34FCAC|nr:PLP-dependent aminotransferase family protein [Pseudonocardia sp. TRM90224]